jgi:hypothetical protein
MQITVTDDDIINGLVDNEEQCAIALAIRHSFPLPLQTIEVGNDYVKVNGVMYNLPHKVSRFIENFDSGLDYLGDELEPFTFELNV